jgi:MoxR-like ATPase
MKKFNLLEVKEIIKKFYTANQTSIWDDRYNLFLRGVHGLGKTAIVRQVAKELSIDYGRDVNVHIIRLSQYEDISQLTGKNTIFLKMKNSSTNDEIEINEKYVDIYYKMGYLPIPGSEEMRYTIPDIIKNIQEGDILFFDDYGRQLTHFNNSVMEIINEGQYLSWKLPKGVVTILSGNPDDGDYQVIENDFAQKDRYEIIDVMFDVKIWSLYAEKEKLEDIYISFMYNNENLFSKVYNNEDIETTVEQYSPRKWTKLFKYLTVLYGNNYKSHLSEIFIEGYTFVGEQISELINYINDVFSNVCTSKDLLNLELSEKEVENLIEKSVNIHQSVKSYISFRLINYLFANKKELFEDKVDLNEKVSDRVINILKNKNFEKDIKSNFIMTIAKDTSFKNIYSKYNEIIEN